MNSPFTKLVLVPDPRPVASSPRARRFRLARLDLNPARDARSYEHLSKVYD
jgi:hypothetical protein